MLNDAHASRSDISQRDSLQSLLIGELVIISDPLLFLFHRNMAS